MVALNVDYQKFFSTVEAVENAEVSEETAGALVVNLHANFVINEAQRYSDMTFPHLSEMHRNNEAARRYGSLVPISAEDLFQDQPRPFRRPDFADEWHLLRKSWSLHSRGRIKLASKEMVAASERFYSNDPLNDLPDWVWRFCMFLGATRYEQVLRAMMEDVKEAVAQKHFAPLLSDYSEQSQIRARRFFEVIRDYFSAWSEFSQVHFAVAKGLPVSEGHVATTSGFNSVKMFYGSAFEALASSVDVLAFMNNVLEGREWAQFKKIDVEGYLRSDKAKRFDAFADRASFAGLCEERDNQLRNASHHGELHFDSEGGLLSYKTGKGNSGDLVTLAYAEYLSRCSAIFFQIITLLRFELLICQQTETRCPV